MAITEESVSSNLAWILTLAFFVGGIVLVSLSSRTESFTELKYQSIKYIKDARTNVCFAEYNNNLTYTPCDHIPSDLLNIINKD